MKKTIVLMIAGLLLVLAPGAMAANLSLSPGFTTVEVGQSFNVDLVATLEFGEKIDWYDIDVSFDQNVLNFNSYSLGDALGSDAEDFSMDRGFAGIANVAQYAWSDPGDQTGDNILATLTFDALALGDSALGFDYIDLKTGTYAYDTDFDLTLEPAAVNAVPVPGAVWLLGSGLIGLVGLRRKRN